MGEPMTGARIFVAVAFCILGASFLASTGLLIQEFQTVDWWSLIITHSHLFFFFPVFGLLALCAFYVPMVVFTDLYWRHLPWGKLQFLIGIVAMAALSIGVAKWLDKAPRALYEVSPRALLADRGEPAGCDTSKTGTCRRSAMLPTLARLREESQSRVGISKFARNCTPDRMLEVPDEMDKERYCFPANARLKGAACCEVQKRFADEVARLQADPAQHSLSGAYDALVFLPLKVFFVLTVVAIGILLSAWRNRVDLHYKAMVPTLERGVIFGALAMLLWPAMDYGYQQTSNALFGRWGGGPQLRLSLVIAPWALLLLFYFLRRLGKQGETIGQIAGVVTAGVAVLRYEDLNDWAVRLFGVGSHGFIITGLAVVALAGFVALVWPWRSNLMPPAAATPAAGPRPAATPKPAAAPAPAAAPKPAAAAPKPAAAPVAPAAAKPPAAPTK